MANEDLTYHLVAARIDGGPEVISHCITGDGTTEADFPRMIAVKRLGIASQAGRVAVTWHAPIERGSLGEVEFSAQKAFAEALEALERHHATGLKDPERVAEKVRAAHDAIHAITVR